MSDEIEVNTIDELIALALNSYSDAELYEELLGKLRSIATLEVFNKAKALSFCEEPNRRILGVQILCQLGNGKPKFVEQSSKVLLSMLPSEAHPGVIAAIAWGLGHLDAKDREASLVKLKSHPDAEVRLGVVGGLQGIEAEAVTQTLIELSRDIDNEVRSWATFALGSQICADNPDIRQALYDRLSDEDEETHCEAIWGLAQRKDLRVIDYLVERLLSESVIFDDLMAAEAMGVPELLPALIRLRGRQFEGEAYLENAIRICESKQ